MAEATIITAGAACVAAAGVLGTAVMRFHRKVISPLMTMASDWHGVPPRPGVAAKPGIMERLQALEELRPNGGSSMRDAVNRIEDAVTPGGSKDAVTPGGSKLWPG